jgi:hypothetical protein
VIDAIVAARAGRPAGPEPTSRDGG